MSEPVLAGDAARRLGKDAVRSRLLRYTRRAYRWLPRLSRPLILDAGCGTGVPTLELVRLSGGRVVAVDVDRAALAALRERAARDGLLERVLIVQASLREAEFAPGSFDVVWCEGAVAVLGFEQTLRRWRPWLRHGGCLVVHDERAGLEDKLRQVPEAGYELLGHFAVTEEVWRREYYAPLTKRLRDLRRTQGGDPELLAGLAHEAAELETFARRPAACASAFLAMRRP